VSPFRPDLVDVWMFRVPTTGGAPASGSAAGRLGVHRPDGLGGVAGAAAPGSEIEILLMRRAKDDAILPGLWQGVSGGLEAGETATAAALRELSEETDFGPDQIEGFYHLDQVNQFLEPSLGGVLTAAVFAVRLVPDAEPVLSHEHDACVWVSRDAAIEMAVWPAYRESIRRIVENLLDPERAVWFELALDGERARR
jgi:8-oxo-dGTP pyrophosphatase MutT (NUDIX family)